MSEILARWKPDPKQKRSRNSLSRLLNSARKMLLDNTFEQASVQMIVKDAGSSIGSFYNHFSSKEALLNCLLDDYEEQLATTVQNFSCDEDLQNLNLLQRFEIWLRTYVSAANEERGLLRTRVLNSMQFPDKITPFRQQKNAEIMLAVKNFFRPRIDEIKHPGKEKALDFVISIIDKAVAYKIILEGHEDHLLTDLNNEEMIEEFCSIFASYLKINS